MSAQAASRLPSLGDSGPVARALRGYLARASLTLFAVTILVAFLLPLVSMVERPEPLPFSITEAVLSEDNKAVLGENATPAT